MDAFELIHPALGSSQRFPLEQLFAAVRPDAAIRSPHVRHVLYFGALPLGFLLQNERRAHQSLRRLAQKRLLRRGDSTVRFDRFLGLPCYASTAWRIEQIFAKADEAARAGDAALALELNDEAAYYLSCLLSCMTPLNALLVKAARNLMDDEVYEGAGVSLDVSILGDLWDLNPLWLNHQTLGLRGPEDQVEAFYRVAIMKPRGFYDAVSSAIDCGVAATATLKRYGLGRGAFGSGVETLEELCPGFDDRCISGHLQRAYRDLDGEELVRALRLVFVTPFAALYESGALQAVRLKEHPDFVTESVCLDETSGQLDGLLQTAREHLAKGQTAA